MIAEFDLALGETADMIRETTWRFATDRIAPLAALAEAAAALARPGPIVGFRLNASSRTSGWFAVGDERVEIDVAAAARRGEAAPAGALLVTEGGQTWRLAPWRAGGVKAGAATDGAILSPMPGRVIAVDVAVGDRVKTGRTLVTLEAMKMEHGLVAPFDGVVADLLATIGDQVGDGTMLVRIERDRSSPGDGDALSEAR